ncbi:glycosyltransferase family 4 protein [Pinibacter soli]|uniref:Glycosyltransferase family 4 protein n=1 Tax=Pinibacter soli TaxID=3044211 RepID=A0ABT6RDB3_9BACT|nr:glycosyltransferase family 4 protein [Pinibacter soli]MDI3320562.1 glycosyltransferase family 4 protein [Pinibacter soli]
MTSKTLIILTPGFPVNEADTACLPSIQVFVKNLKKNYPLLNIVIITFQYPFVAKKYTWNGIQVIGIGGANKGKLFRLSVWIKVWRILSGLQKQHHIIGILSLWLGECALLGKQFGKKYSIRYYTWLLGQDAKKNNRYKTLTRSSGHELIAISDSVSKTFEEHYDIKITNVIPIGIDNTLFVDKQSERDIDIMAAGSLIPLKQYDVLIEVVKHVKENVGKLKVMLCGEGPEKAKLHDLVERYHLQDDITLTGELPHADVLANMRRTKIFLHSSSYEGFSTVCAEAVGAGAHVISFCKPMRHEIPHWIIVNSVEEMVERTVSLLKNPQLEHSGVTAYHIDDTVTSIMRLFGGE